MSFNVSLDLNRWIILEESKGPITDNNKQQSLLLLQIKVDQRTVGKNISTKSVYSNKREDVTLHYKYPEGLY